MFVWFTGSSSAHLVPSQPPPPAKQRRQHVVTTFWDIPDIPASANSKQAKCEQAKKNMLIWRISALTASLKWAQLRHSWCLVTLYIVKRNIWADTPEKWHLNIYSWEMIANTRENNTNPRPEIAHAGFGFEHAQKLSQRAEVSQKMLWAEKGAHSRFIQHCMIFYARINRQTHLQTSLLKWSISFCGMKSSGTARPCASLHQDPCNISGELEVSTRRKTLNKRGVLHTSAV